MPRKLRIAVSVFFGVLTLTLCILWVRSYWWWDSVYVGVTDHSFAVLESVKGRCNAGIAFVKPTHPFELSVQELGVTQDPEWEVGKSILGFEWWSSAGGFESAGMLIPHWFLVAVTATCSAIPWINRRFSLRTLLLATTLVAFVLGLGAYLAS